MNVLGLDIGGANLKAYHSSGLVRSVPFALWREPTALAGKLRDLARSLPTSNAHYAITMTGELCDCFTSKRQGVEHILKSVRAIGGTDCVGVYSTEGRFLSLEAAVANPLAVASANWHALATLAGKLVPEAELLIDIGSTTTDVIPLQGGKPSTRGLTDPERLQAGELVYRGVRRTPLCALLGDHAAELFATTQDVYLLLGHLQEEPDNRDTADAQPFTREASHRRLARMLCADLETSSAEERLDLARFAHENMMADLTGWLLRRESAPPCVVVSGEGEFLAREALQRVWDEVPTIVSLTQRLGPEVSKAACAYAVAALYAEERR